MFSPFEIFLINDGDISETYKESFSIASGSSVLTIMILIELGFFTFPSIPNKDMPYGTSSFSLPSSLMLFFLFKGDLIFILLLNNLYAKKKAYIAFRNFSFKSG